jgi:predicted nuclease with TOPRIM domain
MAETQGITSELYRAIVTIVDDRVREIRVTREDFDRLTQTVAQLAQAQARTEQRLEELAQAQARTEQRLDRLEAAVERLAEAQARTDAAVQQLAKRVDQLAEAQARTEQRLNELAQAQARTEQRVEQLEGAMQRLAEAQARTEQALQQLATQVGALSDNVGYGLEDIARVVLPGYLKQRYGVTIERLERRIFPIDGQQFDIDLYAEGRRGRRRIVVLGEVKARIYAREVHHFQQVLQAVRPQLPAEPLPVLFGYFIDLSAMESAQDQILLIAAYQPTMEATAPRRRRRTKRV